MNVSRFEKDVQSGFTFWRYHAKKIITNPTEEFVPGASCGKLGEREYVYDWRSQQTFLGCDYIDFSAL